MCFDTMQYIYIYTYTQFAPMLHVSCSHEIFVHQRQTRQPSSRLENARAAIATAISNGEIVPMEKVLKDQSWGKWMKVVIPLRC